MALGCLAAVFCCLWEPVKEALLGLLGVTVTDSASYLRDRAVEAIRDRTVLWGNRIQRLPSFTPSLVGREELLSEILGLLKGDKKGIIGLYGMGGVGKTTLLQKLNNHLLDSGDNPFDVVIWVTVSKDMDIRKIQDDIGIRLGFSRPGAGQGRQLPTDEHDRRRDLHEALFGKRFLLLLDDMWKAFELQNVGIPHPSSLKRGKIVFTTRSRDVCASMDADAQFRVDCLNPKDSWQLFCSKMGSEMDLNHHPVIRPLAESVVERCGGLPLALKTVGRAMSGKTSIGEWENAIRNLSESPDAIRGMEDDVLSILKFSFDRLEDESTKQCLLYCALFPEDHAIDLDKLIGLWIGEGFFDSKYGNRTPLYRARIKGESIINTLKNACLLEDGGSTSVKLHDLVRDMALWLTGEAYKAIVHGNGPELLGGSALFEGWEDAKRISIQLQLQGESDEHELAVPGRECPNLITLLVHATSPSWQIYIPQNFMESMKALCVLDLSVTVLRELPSTIGLLVELRYLNLEWTPITSLPKEMGQLVKLRQLNLRHTPSLSHIPREALVTLESLQSLDLFRSNAYLSWLGDDGNDESEGILLRDLDSNVGRLEELGVNIHTSQGLWNLANSKKFQRCTRHLYILYVPDLTLEDLSIVLEKLGNVESLDIEICESLQGEWRVDGVRQLRRLKWLRLEHLAGLRGFAGDLRCLRELKIDACEELKDLSCVGRLPCLEVLYVYMCDKMVELVQQPPLGDGPRHRDRDGQYINSPSFPMLREMTLLYLPALTSISEGTLPFPSLEELEVYRCPRLKRLPLGLDGGKKIREIKGEQGWWDGLEWDNDSVQSAFAPYFTRC